MRNKISGLISVLNGLLTTGQQCAFCGRETVMHQDACRECLLQLNELWYDANKLPRCAFKYGDIMRTLIRSIKYDDCPYKSGYAARLMYEAWLKNYGGTAPDLITHVPIHISRYKVRGFDQSQLLAAELARLMDRPHIPLFERVKRTKAQYNLNAAQRADNLKDAFKLLILPKNCIKTVMIIDDIYTTGATMRECEKLLPPHITAIPYALCYDELI